jgi:hypothetical protein
MFEIGKSYSIDTWEGSEDGGLITNHGLWTVKEVQLPLVKFDQEGEEWIINTFSPAFAGAEPYLED